VWEVFKLFLHQFCIAPWFLAFLMIDDEEDATASLCSA
jgi:hypothetical protein